MSDQKSLPIDALSFLEKLLSIDSPSGSEENIQQAWSQYVMPYAHLVKTDHAGNVYAILNPSAPYKLLITGHCDEISFIVQHIDAQGFVYCKEAGGIQPQNALGSRVRILSKKGVVHGVVGLKAAHHGDASEKTKAKDLTIDCGFTTKEEALEHIAIGDAIVYDLGFTRLKNGRIAAKGLDNRTGAFIIAEVVRRLSARGTSVGVYAVSTVQEETNMKGAYVAASKVAPHVAIVSDVSFATDYPGNNAVETGEAALGKGPMLSIGSPINKKLNEKIKAAARVHHIDVQYELTPKSTGTDADRIQYTNTGVPVALISLPLRYMHSPSEVADLSDIENTIELFCQTIASFTGDENFAPLDLPLF